MEIKINRGEKFKEMKIKGTERIIYMDDCSLQNDDNGIKESNCESVNNVSRDVD